MIKKTMGQSSSKREVYSDTGLPRETRKISNEQITTKKKTKNKQTKKLENEEKVEQNQKLVEGKKS